MAGVLLFKEFPEKKFVVYGKNIELKITDEKFTNTYGGRDIFINISKQ